jgi:flagellar hook assembly protein FlgD
VLENNFPNPFNPITVIFVDIPFETKVELRIYDILGREVTTLYDGLIEPGRHWFTWDGKADSGERVSSGVYLCRLNTITGVSQIRKLVLTK